MKKIAIAAALAMGLFASGAMLQAADSQTVKGVLIDTHCGKGKDEAKAAGHKKECVKKCMEDGGLQVNSGDKIYKLDEASTKKAKEYINKDDSTTKVEIVGTVDGDNLKIESIKAQEK